MTALLYRVQDDEGRGPYRPGFSEKWVSRIGPPPPPTWMDEFGWDLTDKLRPGEHVGCGFRTLEQVRRWFLPEEIDRLHILGYRLVRLRVDRVLAESRHQVVFARRKPLNVEVEEYAPSLTEPRG